MRKMKNQRDTETSATNKSEVIRLRVSPDLKAQIQAAAEAENRTVSNYVENLIKEALLTHK